MTKTERIEALEREVQELKKRPTQEFHYHFPPTPITYYPYRQVTTPYHPNWSIAQTAYPNQSTTTVITATSLGAINAIYTADQTHDLVGVN